MHRDWLRQSADLQEWLERIEMPCVLAAPRSVNGKEPEQGNRQSVEMGIGMHHCLGPLLGPGTE